MSLPDGPGAPGGEDPVERPESGAPEPRDRGGPEPPVDQPTEERFAVEAGLEAEPAEAPFEGIPPEQLPPPQPLPDSGEFPALEPEFADALREAGRTPGAEGEDGTVPGPEPAGAGEDTGQTVEYAPGEAPEERVGEYTQPAEPAVAPPPTPPPGTTAVPPAFGHPPAGGDGEAAPKPKRYWWRFSLASFVIVAAVAAATASSVLLYLDDIANALGHGGKLQKQLSPILKDYTGGPQNILILGSDKRAGTPGDPGRSDTTMLLRLDPDQSRIALMSIPRDLKVDIPGYGIDKFNAAYTYGGPKLTLQMVRRLTGLQFNHVVNVDFLGFVRAVDAIGCTWTDVDRRYYHSNEGLSPSEQYSEINVKAGYQRLCGKDALAYVRYRHTDTDLVRSARQQDFLREARQRVPISTLLQDYPKLIKIFTSYTTSDISDGGEFLDVLKLFFEARSAAIKEVHFPAVLGPSYVYASRSDIRQAVNKFLNIEPSGGPRGALDLGKQEKTKKKGRPKAPGGDGLVPSPTSGRQEAEAVARQVGPGFPVFYPTRLPSGAYYVEDSSYEHIQNPRVYHMRDTDGNLHGAYRMTLQLPQGDYFGVQGILGWTDPPILASPSLTKTFGDRDYEIFLDGDRVRLVAWHEGDNTYWVSNSLLQTLTNEQMLGIARSAEAITPQPKRGSKGRGKQ